MPWGTIALAGASAGLSLFQHGGTSKAAAKQAGQQAYQARTEQHIQRMQSDRDWQTRTRLRGERLRGALASQSAVYASRGITGGLSARLAEMTSRHAASREQADADFSRRSERVASRYATNARLSGARTAASQAISQSRMDLFSSVLGSADQAWGAWQDHRAERGNDD